MAAPSRDPDEPVSAALRREAQERYDHYIAQLSPRNQRRARSALGMALDTIRAFITSRLSGLAAEMAFWGLFALPWVLLGVVAGLSSLQSLFGQDLVTAAHDEVLALVDRIFSSATTEALTPMVDELFDYGSSGLSLVSLVVALWSGSKLVATSVQGVVLVSGDTYEGYVRTRARGLVIYAAGLFGLLIVLILLVLELGWRHATSVHLIFWVTMIALIALLLHGLYLFAPRQRPTWRFVLPGTLFAALGWFAASIGIRLYVSLAIDRGSLYAIVGAPIALMLWAYVSAYVVLLGALLNRILRSDGDEHADRGGDGTDSAAAPQ